LDTHWTRFLTTLDLVADLSPERILDVGVFPPFVFEAMLVNACPDVDLHGVWEGPEAYYQQIRSREDQFPDFEILLRPANIERDPLPYADESFDLVLGMEVFEHLALDPHFFLAQAARVLRPGGHLILSTPNIVSHRGVWKALNGHAPYSFGLFVPTGGVYGRHNREYAPHEVETLAMSAGFACRSLQTFDVYDDKIDPDTADLLYTRGDDLSLRGETIFYVGQKTSTPKDVPAGYYHGDPVRMIGRLRVEKWEAQTGLTHIQVENGSPSWWPREEGYATSLLAEWIDPQNLLRHTNVFLPLNDALGPGDRQTIVLRLDPDTDSTLVKGTLRLELFQNGIGRLSGTGRANSITLACSEEAFVRLSRQRP
jgi:SAM-dependent methyltransferase